jgi:hypothetical protein
MKDCYTPIFTKRLLVEIWPAPHMWTFSFNKYPFVTEIELGPLFIRIER